MKLYKINVEFKQDKYKHTLAYIEAAEHFVNSTESFVFVGDDLTQIIAKVNIMWAYCRQRHFNVRENGLDSKDFVYTISYADEWHGYFERDCAYCTDYTKFAFSP